MIFPHIISRGLATGALGAMLAISATLPALAFDSSAECHNAVNETTRTLLKANVANADLDEIDAVLVQAAGKCDAGDLSGAEADLSTAGEMIEAASQ